MFKFAFLALFFYLTIISCELWVKLDPSLRKLDASQYVENLTLEAKNRKFDDVFVRTEAIKDVLAAQKSTLSGNTAIVGKTGVGKTMFTKGFAKYLVEHPIKNGPQIILIRIDKIQDLAAQTGAQDTNPEASTFFALFKKAVEKYGRNNLFIIDEIQTIIKSRNFNTELLKPFLYEYPNFLFITTMREFQEIFPDPALQRRLSIIQLSEPSFEEGIKIIKSSRLYHTHKHNLPDNIIKYAAQMSIFYFESEGFPSNTLRLLDRALSRIFEENEKSLSEEDINQALKAITQIAVNREDLKMKVCVPTNNPALKVTLDDFKLDKPTFEAYSSLPASLCQNGILRAACQKAFECDGKERLKNNEIQELLKAIKTSEQVEPLIPAAEHPWGDYTRAELDLSQVLNSQVGEEDKIERFLNRIMDIYNYYTFDIYH